MILRRSSEMTLRRLDVLSIFLTLGRCWKRILVGPTFCHYFLNFRRPIKMNLGRLTFCHFFQKKCQIVGRPKFILFFRRYVKKNELTYLFFPSWEEFSGKNCLGKNSTEKTDNIRGVIYPGSVRVDWLLTQPATVTFSQAS
jgi:hypothetical protein